MIQVIDGSNAHLFTDTLKSFAELRSEVFVKRLGWKIAGADDRFEQDQFDTKDAVYLLVQNPRGEVVGGARLLDTSRASLLAEVFPYLVDGQVPADPSVFEVTRFVVDHRRDRLEGCGNVCAELLWGLQEYGAWASLTQLVSVSYLSLEPILRRAGYRSRRMGTIVEMDGLAIAALEHDVNGSVLERARQRMNVTHVLNMPMAPPVCHPPQLVGDQLFPIMTMQPAPACKVQ